MNYTALQVKTSYSILESLNNINELVSKANNLGYTSFAITDNNNLFGVMEFYLECKKYNIKPIIGIELNFNDNKILLYAKNNQGYKKLIKLSTKASEETLEIKDLSSNEDLILVMPYPHINKEIYEMFKDKYIGYYSKQERNKVPSIYKCVFINDVSYLNKEDYEYLDYSYMIKEGKILGEYELHTHINKHLLTQEEAKEISTSEDIANTKEISDMCNVELGYQKGLLPVYDENINSSEYLTKLCNKGLNKRLNNNINLVYQERLDYELSIIIKMQFCDYFLIVWDYVRFAKFNNILVGPGRGSAVGSLVSYTLGITEIDPIKYNLPFERFLNLERKKMPDIDIDFDNEKTDEVIKYVINKYGEKKVAGIITFSRMTAKQVIRDVSRVLNINLSIVDSVNKLINYDTLEETYKNNNKFYKLINSSPQLKKLYQISLKLEGSVRNPSVHAAGIVMSKYNIDETIPLYKNSNMYLTGFTKNYLEPLGLLKMDFLRLATLNFIDEVITNIRNQEKINITFEKIPVDDKKTLKIFYDVKTDGIFQFESQGMKNFLSKLKVDSFDDIVAALALFRPGPMDNIETYIRRKRGQETISYLHPSLEPILKSTYGIIVYQEQIMQIAVVLAGYTYGEADIFRSAMSSKDETKIENERPKFIQGAIKKGYDLDLATQVFNLIIKFANYGFNKSHSVAYATIAYKMAFLKTYFLKYFLTSSLTNVIGNNTKTRIYITEARNNKITILPPCINKSSYRYTNEKEGIRCPLSIIKSVGKAGCSEIEKEREKETFKSFIDFVLRCYSPSLNRKVITSLIYGGCFATFGYNKKTLINNLDNIINYVELAKDCKTITLEEPYIIPEEEYSKNELIELEYEIFGFYLTSHPTLIYKTTSEIDIIDVPKYFNKEVKVAILVERIKEVITKNNEAMAFVNGSDNTDSISITLFPKVYSNNKDIKKGDIIIITGKVERRFDEYQIVAKVIKKILN